MRFRHIGSSHASMEHCDRNPEDHANRIWCLLVIIALGSLGLLAIYWGLANPVNQPSSPSATRSSASKQEWVKSNFATRSPQAISRVSPFQLLQFAGPDVFENASPGCRLKTVSPRTTNSTLRSYIPIESSTCRTSINGTSLSVRQVWFGRNGLRSALLTLPDDPRASQQFWVTLSKTGRRSENIGEVYCWSDGCARRSGTVLGIWRGVK